MKKDSKLKVLLYIIIGIIIGSIGVASAYSLLASNVGFQPKDTTWQVDNVKDAIDGLYSTMSAKNYSSDEKLVGTWIDGKPIYQKTINMGVINASTSTFRKSLDVSNVDNIINYNFIAKNESGTVYINSSFTPPMWLDGTCSVLDFNISEDAVSAEIYNGYYKIVYSYITLQYTKTTD